jgi:hypothetical protein
MKNEGSEAENTRNRVLTEQVGGVTQTDPLAPHALHIGDAIALARSSRCIGVREHVL